MPSKNPEVIRRYRQSPRGLELHRLREAKRRRLDPERTKRINRKCNFKCKLIVLTHYGKDGIMQCCWPDCNVIDPDMLSIDHIANDGAERRRNGEPSGNGFYSWIRSMGFPGGLQTLCFNHQMKKRIESLRSNYGREIFTC